MDNEVVRQLLDTQANLRARRLLPAAEAIGQGLSLIAMSDEARQEAVKAASVVPSLRSEIASLKQQNARLQAEVEKARAETQLAQVPREEEQAKARNEVRDVLRPFLKEGEPGTRMLALTIRQALDESWGKEVISGPEAKRHARLAVWKANRQKP